MISTLLLAGLALANFLYYSAKVFADIRARRWRWAATGSIIGIMTSVIIATMVKIILNSLYSG